MLNTERTRRLVRRWYEAQQKTGPGPNGLSPQRTLEEWAKRYVAGEEIGLSRFRVRGERITWYKHSEAWVLDGPTAINTLATLIEGTQ